MLNKDKKISQDLERFYSILSKLEKPTSIPQQGVYLFFEPNELRCNQLSPRVVRVGTHALNHCAKSTLQNRLKSHIGHRDGGGNHRVSVFRRHIGACIIKKEKIDCPHWGKRFKPDRQTKAQIDLIERKVSAYIGNMTFLCVAVIDNLGPDSLRAYFERNMIGLLSNHQEPLDPPSSQWLGHHSTSIEIRKSGLWNKNFVNHAYDEAFLDILEQHIKAK